MGIGYCGVNWMGDTHAEFLGRYSLTALWLFDPRAEHPTTCEQIVGFPLFLARQRAVPTCKIVRLRTGGTNNILRSTERTFGQETGRICRGRRTLPEADRSLYVHCIPMRTPPWGNRSRTTLSDSCTMHQEMRSCILHAATSNM